ncbi:hypothetical protein [Limoniibacter endophyticus]|uniref:Uncharacterized protein n=1 Tax=Limoniibacter endophyticus TaxID=1565040 RepID=A0A8J3GFA5_9HYPH|nr:hypothetical protein [Limoniibacter endophyticus]GHC61584.1 hypothetical protein GCM10010136_02220 [Limoniibacter endophyticus]
MKIRALKTLVGEYGRLAKGDIADLPNWQARPLLALGYVVTEQEAIDGGRKDTKAPGGELHRRGSRRSKSSAGAGTGARTGS